MDKKEGFVSEEAPTQSPQRKQAWAMIEQAPARDDDASYLLQFPVVSGAIQPKKERRNAHLRDRDRDEATLLEFPILTPLAVPGEVTQEQLLTGGPDWSPNAVCGQLLAQSQSGGVFTKRMPCFTAFCPDEPETVTTDTCAAEPGQASPFPQLSSDHSNAHFPGANQISPSVAGETIQSTHEEDKAISSPVKDQHQVKMTSPLSLSWSSPSTN